MKLLLATLIWIGVPAFAEEVLPPPVALGETVAAKISEAEIPVQIVNTKKATQAENPWLRFVLGLSVFGTMACGAYFFSKRYLKAGVVKNEAAQIKVLTQHYLGPKKSLAIIRVAGESILVGVTDQNINMIKSLSLLDEELPETVPQNFKSVFSNAESKGNETATQEGEDFSISAVKDFVSTKLKNMRSFQ